VLIRAARDQAASLDPAAVRAQVADAEAARRRAEAAAVTAQARQAEAESETQALAEALQATRAGETAARNATQTAADAARAARQELTQVRADTGAQISAARDQASQQIAAARAETDHALAARDDALTAARDARAAADAETSRARQAEADARAETDRVRADAARERDALHDSYHAQLDAARALTDAERARAERAEAQLETERADRRQLTTHLTSNNGPGLRLSCYASLAVSAGRHSRRTAVAGMPANELLRHAHPGAGMLIVAAPSGTGGTRAGVTDGSGGADMRRASSRLIGADGESIPITALAMPIRVLCVPPADHAAEITDPLAVRHTGAGWSWPHRHGGASRVRKSIVPPGCWAWPTERAGGPGASALREGGRTGPPDDSTTRACGSAVTGPAASAGLTRFAPAAIASRRRKRRDAPSRIPPSPPACAPGRERDGRQR